MKHTNEHDEIAFLSHKIIDLNKKLIESEKAKSRFLSLVANELNNPMTVLLGLLPRLKPLDGSDDTIFKLVHNEARKLYFRVQNLVAAAEIENGALTLSRENIDPSDLLKEVIDELGYLIEERNITIAIDDTLASPVATDPLKLSLILKNLVANGCAYGVPDAVVEISLTCACSMLVIAVGNRGEGPKVACKPQIFTRFADGPGGEHGLGIGLSVVRELCEVLEGTVDYDVEEGSVTFTVRLPLENGDDDDDTYDDAIEL